MKNLSKKLEYIISIIVILTLISLTMKTCSQNNTIREKDLLINSLNDTVKIWKDKQNISHTKSQIIETSNVKDFLEIKNLKNENKILQEEVLKYKSKIKKGGSITVATTNVNTKISSKSKIIDSTFIIEDKKYPIYTSNFNKNEWIKGTIKAGPDSIIIDPLKIKIEQTFIIGEDRTGFLGLGRPKPFIEVVNKNPYAETEKLKTYQVDIKSKNKNKTWFIIGTVMGATGVYFLIK